MLELTDPFNQTYIEKDVEFKEDPLVLSVAAKDLLAQHPGSYFSLEDLRVYEHVNDNHKEEAECIRKYYGRKFIWKQLESNRSISDFRSRVCYLLENRIRTCKDRDSGIYYKLPYFYQEDMIYDEFKKQYNTTDVPKVIYGGSTSRKQQLTLTYLKSTTSRQQKRNLLRFWFTDSKYLYSIEIVHDNPLLEMFKQLVIEKMTITLDTYYNVDRIDQMYFYKLYNFSLVKGHNEVS
jgi:hypothetical protein